MATYKEIKGVTVQTQDTDPQLNVGSFSSGGSMDTDRARLAGDGIQTAFVVFGGTTPSPGTQLSNTELYDGSSFSETGDLSLGRTDLAGAGTTTAALAVAGSAGTGLTNTAEAFGGSSWTSSPSCNTARYQLAGFGTQTNMVIAGGSEPSFSNKTEEWNGSSWAEKNEINTARQGLNSSGAGVYTAGIIAGGRKAHPSNPGQEANDTEIWNGTSWTEVNELNEAKQLGGVFGTSTSAIYAGGVDTATLSATESWNGTSWSEVNDLSTARYYTAAGGASNQSGIVAGGAPGAATEEWGFPDGSILVEGMLFLSGGSALKGFGKAAGIPSGVWSSGGSMSSSREQGADFGSLAAGVAAGGGGSSTDVEEYNGTSWSEGTELGTAGAAGGATGSQTAGIIFGYAQSTPLRVDTMTYNGTGFTEANNMNTGRNVGGSVGGLQTAAIYAGGSGSIDNVEQWNGSTWSEVSEINDGRYFLKGGGTVTAAVLAGGYGGSPSTNPAQSETWNGASWSEGNELNTGRAFLTGGGSEYTSAMIFGGGPPVIDNTEFWNGTSWTEMNDMATASETSHGTTQGTGAGTYRARTPAGGATEEWTVEAALSTVTVS